MQVAGVDHPDRTGWRRWRLRLRFGELPDEDSELLRVVSLATYGDVLARQIEYTTSGA